MSFLGAPDAPDVFDPYHFPNFTLKSLERDITLFVYGISVYETILCFKAYFSICSKEKMKTPIFRFMTLAVFSMFCATLLLLLLQINKSRTDLITSTGEYTANILQCIFLVLDKIGYYIAATFRTGALLKKFPKALYCFYSLLAISLINQIVIFGFLVDLFNKLYYSTPESFFNDLPGIVEAGLRYQNEAAFTVVFDMVFANSLAVSFLYPIFTSLDMDVLSAIKAMIKLGDVQKVLFFSASSILCVAFGLGLVDPALSLALLTVWLNTQNTQFLHLSYFSAAELLVTNNKKLRSNLESRPKAQESVQSGQAVKSAKLENV